MGTNNSNSNFTMQFSLENDRSKLIEETLRKVETALEEKGYNPVNQLVGYIMSGDPTYITSHKGARNLIRQYLSDPNTKVICIDFTDEYNGKFSDLNPIKVIPEETAEQAFKDIDFIEKEVMPSSHIASFFIK